MQIQQIENKNKYLNIFFIFTYNYYNNYINLS